MLLRSSWKLRRTNEENVADATRWGKIANLRLAIRTYVECIPWLWMTWANGWRLTNFSARKTNLDHWASLLDLDLSVHLHSIFLLFFFYLSCIWLTWNDKCIKKICHMLLVLCKEELALCLLADMLEDVNWCGETNDGDLYFHLNNFAYRFEDVARITHRKTRKHYENFFPPVAWESCEIVTGTV